MTDKTGGPAFPMGNPLDTRSVPDAGMTLRDYFAAAALQGILTNGAGGWDRYQHRAENAYLHADAMISERSKP